jgi:hypothetical protein
MSVDRSDHPARSARLMGNRHHNKKLRVAARAAMVQTGESYQTALSRLRCERQFSTARGPDVDLIAIEYFGLPLILATFEILGDLSCVVPSVHHRSQRSPKSPLFALAGQRYSS